MRVLSVLVLVGCPTNDPDPKSDGSTEPVDGVDSTTSEPDTEEPDPQTGDTGTETDPAATPPTRLEVLCDTTDNPLRFACTVTVEPAQPVELTFVRTDGLSATRTRSSAAVATEHILPLYFMAPLQDYDVTAWATGWPEQVAVTVVTTGAPIADVASGLSIDGVSTMGMIGTHLPCDSLAVAVVYDTTTGDLLWYQLMDPGGQFGSLDMVQFTDDFTVLGESSGDVIEVDLTGQDIIRLDDLDDAFGVTAGGVFGDFHHDITKRNGVYAVFYQEEYGGGFFPDVLDTVILFDGTGTELARWYPIDHLDLPPDWGGDFLHTNSVFFDANGDLLLSWLSQDTIAKIEGDWTLPEFGTPIWILGGNSGNDLDSTLTTDWSAIGQPASFDEQHSLIERPDGRLQLLDNQHGRGLVISVDELAGTATVDAAYDTREGSCGPQGTSRSTLGGNAVVGCAGDWVREYDGVTGAQIWEAEVQCPGGGGGGGFSDGATRWYPLDGW